MEERGAHGLNKTQWRMLLRGRQIVNCGLLKEVFLQEMQNSSGLGAKLRWNRILLDWNRGLWVIKAREELLEDPRFGFLSWEELSGSGSQEEFYRWKSSPGAFTQLCWQGQFFPVHFSTLFLCKQTWRTYVGDSSTNLGLESQESGIRSLTLLSSWLYSHLQVCISKYLYLEVLEIQQRVGKLY